MRLTVKKFRAKYNCSSVNPIFIFDNAAVYADDDWWFDNSGKVRTLSPTSGYIRWESSKGQYVENCHYKVDIDLGQLIAVQVVSDMDAAEACLMDKVCRDTISNITSAITVVPRYQDNILRGIR